MKLITKSLCCWYCSIFVCRPILERNFLGTTQLLTRSVEGLIIVNIIFDRHCLIRLAICQPKRARGPKPISAGHFGGRRHFSVALLVTTSELLGPYVVLYHFKFQGHGFKPPSMQWAMELWDMHQHSPEVRAEEVAERPVLASVLHCSVSNSEVL